VLAAGGFLDPAGLVERFGMVGVFLIVFAESGLLIGFFLPGDSLLFTAGLFASQDRFGMNLPVLLVGCFIAAVVGDQVGYLFGRRVGPALFDRPKSRLFNPKHVVRAHEFFERYGPRTIVLARFVPIVRTFAPIVAGVSNMNYRTFVAYNLIGGFVWAIGVTTAGFLLGRRFPALADNLVYVSAIIVAISLLPGVVEFVKHRRSQRQPA
jgi:membrane-associated protein